MMQAEQQLPAPILAKAVILGREYGWRRGDIASAIAAAPSVGLANVGGEVNFVLPEGICDLYWLAFGCRSPRPGEPWDAYVNRSAQETLASLEKILSHDLVRAGVENFASLKEKLEQGVDLEPYLLFVASFATKEDIDRRISRLVISPSTPS